VKKVPEHQRPKHVKQGVGELLFTIDSQCILAECALWHAPEQAIYWVDIVGAKIQSYQPSTKHLVTYEVPHRIGCFAFTEIPNQIIAAFDIGIARYQLDTGELEWLAQPEKHISHNRFNDGRVDRQGRFWAGSMSELDDLQSDKVVKGALYCLSSSSSDTVSCQSKVQEVLISNGLCWSKDGKTMYHADSPERRIYAYDFEPQNALLSNKRVFAETTGHCFPDGSIVDADDYVWNAQWGASRVVRYTPSGKLDLCLSLPVSQGSSVAIGGPNMDWLIVTTAKHSLAPERLLEEPQAGNIFVYQLHGIRGIKEPICLL
jgi:sugar lactone lactonase YvrE